MKLIRNVALVCFCAIGSAFAQAPPPAPSERSIVYTAHDSNAIANYETNPRLVKAMVDRLVLAVTGQPDVGKAWGSLVAPNDKIGIKISAAGGELFTTHHDVVIAIVDGLVAAGHPRSSIVVWDRSLEGTKGAGYKKGDGFELKSIAPHDGYDPKAIFTAPLLGKLVWGDLDYVSDKGKTVPLSDTENTSSVSHFCRILSSDVTKVINVPVMSNSTTNGIAGCLYNMTIPNIDNWRRFAQGTGFGAESIALLYANPTISQKVVLNIMDGLNAQYGGGPASQPNFALHHATLYASKDPVAIDAVVLKRLEQWRSKENFPPIGRLASYVQTATTVGLGNSDTSRIEVKNAGR